MSAEHNGTPAFPTGVEHGLSNGTPGMELRDYFAAKAMAVILASMLDCGDIDHRHARLTASAAYAMADKMLAERTKTSGVAT